MKCLNCGCDGEHFLCADCTTAEILNKIFNEIRSYKSDACENPYLAEYTARLTEKYAERDIIPQILELFDFEVAEYYYCQYYRMSKDARFEKAAIAYLEGHNSEDIRTQKILYSLIDSYLPNDFIKPRKWCEQIAESDAYCCDLYAAAAKYFAMIGEYDLADAVAEKGLTLCRDNEHRMPLLFHSPENMIAKLEKQKEDTHKYRTKKPYWPATEERRRVVAMFYDEKGIKYPRIENRPEKIKENEFAPIAEYLGKPQQNYCAFWCSEAFSVSAARSIYQIAAVKVRDGKIEDTFESFVRPWDTRMSGRKSAANEVGVSIDVIESAEDVDIVLPQFFAFVGADVLVSTDALGNQAKLISRAARYAGMREIKNEFYDILDMAADTSVEFDFANNTRAYLLEHFAISEGKTALEKARINQQLYDILINYGE